VRIEVKPLDIEAEKKMVTHIVEEEIVLPRTEHPDTVMDVEDNVEMFIP
jgi:hypothetical protein